MKGKREHQGSLRLTFEYRGRSVELVDVQHVDAIAPEPPPSATGRAGYWLELHERGGRGLVDTPLFRRLLSDPLGHSVELPSGDPDRPFERATVEDSSGTFQVMIPAADDGEVLLLHVDPERRRLADAEEEGEELGRFDLRAHRRREGSE